MPALEAIVPAHVDFFHLIAIGKSFDQLGAALRAIGDPYIGPFQRGDCDGCDNPDELRVRLVVYPDSSEAYLCADCRADLP